MQEEHRCIYCNTPDDLSKSDIIADALTNARIYNNNVCRVAHNNEFSDLFESEVIEKLAFITNNLDIKSSKGKNYPKYDAKLTINGVEYETRMSSQSELFKEGKVLTSVDGKSKLADMSLIEKMAHGDKETIESVDINHQVIEQIVPIDINVFFSESMYRMISKIAYEWYCSENRVSGKHNEFSNTIQYITEGTGNIPVSVITDEEAYKSLREHSLLGSHSLFSYNTGDGREFVAVSLFGIAIYRVLITNTIPEICHKNCSYIELTTNGEKKDICTFESIQDASDKAFLAVLDERDTQQKKIGGMNIIISDSNDIRKVRASLILTFVLPMMQRISMSGTTIEGRDEIAHILLDGIKDIIQSNLLQPVALKRFVKEYFGDMKTPIKINDHPDNKKDSFMFYIIYRIGKSGRTEIKESELKNFLPPFSKQQNHTASTEIDLDDEIEDSMVSAILSDKEYSAVLQQGAEVIKRSF